ncbi:MAG: radical SAM protein [Solobacterium sp.]|nr:radical SAM protein [Solobacterium sp.]
MREIWNKAKNITPIIKEQKLDPSGSYRLSQFVLPFENQGQRYYYHTLTRQCLQIEAELPELTNLTYEQVKEDPDLLFLAKEYYLVPENKDEAAFYQGIYQILRILNRKQGMTHYMILPTLACNARCVYCYEEGRPQESMTKETVERTIQYILETRRQDHDLHLGWFGGEPLMRPDVIDRISQAMRENGIEYRSSVVSNGSLITEEMAEKMVHDWHVEKIQLSMDCAEQDYIARKKYFHYDNTYWQVMKNADLLAGKGIAVSIRCNVDAGNMDQMPQFVKDLESTVKNKDHIALYFAPLFDSRIRNESAMLWKRVFEMDEPIHNAGFGGSLMFRPLTFKANACMADHPSGNAVITPNGDLYTCEHCEPGTSYGNIFEGVTRPEILQGYLGICPVREKCRNCVLLPDCTSFDKCPNLDYYCRESKTEKLLRLLRQMVESANRQSPEDETEADSYC